MKKQEKTKRIRKVNTTRSKAKYPNLIPRYAPKIRQDQIDQDYLDQLNDEELAWLNKFMGEYIGAGFNHDETDIDTSPEGKKLAYDRNNARNRDLYGQVKAGHWSQQKLVDYDSIRNNLDENQEVNTNLIEDVYLDFLESKELDSYIKEYKTFMKNFTEVDE